MSNDFFDQFSQNNSEQPTHEPPAANPMTYNPYTQKDPATSLFEQPSAQPEQPTPQPAEQSAQNSYSAFEPVVQPFDKPAQQVDTPETQSPDEDNSYAKMYRPTDTSSVSQYSATEMKSADPYSASDNASDGYYYRSFTQHNEHEHSRAAERKNKEKKNGSGIGKGAIAALLIICILVSGASGFGGAILANKLNHNSNSASDSADADSTAADSNSSTKTTSATATSSGPDKTTAEITDIAAPAVVEITTEVVQTSDFYGQYIQQGAGSGVIIKSDGTIITNNHVIENAKDITVTLRSGESFVGSLIGTDEELDIALIKIDPGDTELTVATIGDSDTLKVGDKSVIIGNPLGTLGGSVTEGIISALDRSIVIDGKTMNLMQTDAAINAGNSGGGMFNGQGELVGIVVAKNASGEVDNIGFVIPINSANSILEDLTEYGYVRGKADTGMTFVDLTNPLYTWYYYGTGTPGCYIASVDSGSNAEKAGFEKGDRVVSIDGEAISESADIKKIVSKKSTGDEIKIEIERGGKTGTLTLTLEEKIPESIKNK